MWFFSSKKSPQYKLQNLIFQSKSIIQYSLYDGIKISDQNQFSIFEIKADPTSPLQEALSRNALKIWKTFRHPAIPTFHDSYENDGNIYIVTEKLLPFNNNKSDLIESNNKNNDQKLNENIESQLNISLTNNEILWAVYTLADFVCFLGDNANAIHGNIQQNALFMTYGHELKIAGLHWMTVNGNGPINDFYNDYENLVLDVNNFQTPKTNKIFIDPKATFEEISITKNRDKAMSFYSTIDSKFIGSFISTYRSQLPERVLSYGDFWSSNYFLSFSSYYATSGSVPPTPKMFLDDEYCWNPPTQPNDSKNNNNDFIHILLFLKDLPLKEAEDREIFFEKLNQSIKIFSIQTLEFTILPILISSLSYTKSANETPLILDVIFSIISNPEISEKSFEEIVVPSMIPLFENKNRNIRIHLLKNIQNLIKHFSPKIINDKIFPNVIFGLNDSVSAMKSATIISMVSFAPKLNKDNNKTLIRELKKLLANDQDASIRCNSVICIAKIAETIDSEIRIQTLISSFCAASKDSFGQTRKAAISGFKICKKFFSSSPDLISNNILTTLSPLCNDEIIENRILAIKTMKDYLDLLLSSNDSFEMDQISSSNSRTNDDAEQQQQQNLIPENKVQFNTHSAGSSPSKSAFPPPPGFYTMSYESNENDSNNSYSYNYNQNNQTQSNETDSSSTSVIAHYPSDEQCFYQSYDEKPKMKNSAKSPLDYDEDEYWKIIKAQPPKPAKSEEVRDAMMLFSNPPK